MYAIQVLSNQITDTTKKKITTNCESN